MDDWSFGFGDTGDYGITDLDLSNMDFGGLDPETLAILNQLQATDDSGLFTGGTPIEDYTYGFDLGGIKPPGGGGKPGGGAPGASSLSQLGRMLGMGSDGSNLAGLIPLLASVFGGINANNATKEATERMQQSVTDANASTRDILGGAGAAYQPYSDAGKAAMAQMAGQGPSTLAAGFSPIGGGVPMKAGGPVGQTSALAQAFGALGQPSALAAGFRPLGSGRSLRQIGGR